MNLWRAKTSASAAVQGHAPWTTSDRSDDAAYALHLCTCDALSADAGASVGAPHHRLARGTHRGEARLVREVARDGRPGADTHVLLGHEVPGFHICPFLAQGCRRTWSCTTSWSTTGSRPSTASRTWYATYSMHLTGTNDGCPGATTSRWCGLRVIASHNAMARAPHRSVRARLGHVCSRLAGFPDIHGSCGLNDGKQEDHLAPAPPRAVATRPAAACAAAFNAMDAPMQASTGSRPAPSLQRNAPRNMNHCAGAGVPDTGT